MNHKPNKVTPYEIETALPQTQCGLCNHAGCTPYAAAIASGGDSIDHCHPGGLDTLYQLANILNIDPEPYIATVQSQYTPPAVVNILESECNVCTK